jgi:hypothetical protein
MLLISSEESRSPQYKKAAVRPLFERGERGRDRSGKAMHDVAPLNRRAYREILRQTEEGKFQGFVPL